MRRYAGFVTLCVLGVVAAGCQGGPGGVAEMEVEGPVEVWIFTSPHEMPIHEVFTIEGFPTVLQVTSMVALVQTTVHANGEEWPVSIAGVQQDIAAKKVWRYEISGEFPAEAPNVKHVAPRERLIWRLQ
jgi:hypothetical protein